MNMNDLLVNKHALKLMVMYVWYRDGIRWFTVERFLQFIYYSIYIVVQDFINNPMVLLRYISESPSQVLLIFYSYTVYHDSILLVIRSPFMCHPIPPQRLPLPDALISLSSCTPGGL